MRPPRMNSVSALQNGDGIDADAEKAAQWFQKASDQDFAPAKVNLGLLYVRGQGVTRDYATALKLFTQAADKGDAWALNNLGSLYEMGWHHEGRGEGAEILPGLPSPKETRWRRPTCRGSMDCRRRPRRAGAGVPAQSQGN